MRGYFDLADYQLQAVDFTLKTPRCALWIDLGLGKTSITLTALEQLISEGEIRRALVVAPLRVARKGWPDELATWSHLKKIKAVRCIGDAATRLRGLRTEGHLHLINFQNIQWLRDIFYRVEKRPGKKTLVTQIRRLPWDCIVIDEATNVQDPQGAWYTALRHLQRGVPRLIELTGDPIPNSYMGLWSQINLLDQGLRLGGSIEQYRKQFFTYDKGAESYSIQETGPARIQRAVADISFTLREEDHLLGLPPYPEPEFIRVDLTPEETKLYRQMQRQFVLELDGEQITAVNAGVVWGKLLQLSNGSIWVDEEKWLPFHEHKLRALEAFLREEREPVLVVYGYRPDLYRMGPVLDRLKKRWRVLKNERDEDDFNDDKLDVLVMHPMSGSHGLNLHYGSARKIIWFGLTPSADRYRQSNARLFGGRRRLAKVGGRIIHIVGNGTQDIIVVDKIKTKTFNSESMKQAMVQLHRELRR